MLKQFLCCLGLGLSTSIAHAQWVYQSIGFASTQAAPFLFDAVDASTAWGVNVGTSSYVALQVSRTTNVGQTWTISNLPVQAGVSEDATSLAALSATSAWVTTVNANGSGGRILHTSDGGLNWTVQSSATVFGSAASYPGLIRFFSPTEGVAVGAPLSASGGFEIYTTSNAGSTWTRSTTVPLTVLNEDIAVTAPSVVGTTIWFATSAGRVFRSTDKGLTWTAALVDANAELTNVLFRDAQNGLALVIDDSGTNHQLYRSADGGATWVSVVYTGPLHGAALSGVPGTSQYISVGANLGNGDQGSSYSRDNGQTWVAIDNTLHHLNVEFVSSTVGWSGGFQPNGTQFNGGAIRYSGTALATRTDVALQAGLQVAPNPAVGGCFTVQATTGHPTSVRVLDTTGRLVHQQAWANAAALSLDLSREPVGLYVLEIQAPSGTARQKVVVQ
jgi:hypothetical protein